MDGKKHKFSVMEMFIVVAILLIMAPIVRPRVLSATFMPVRDFFHMHATR